MGSPWRPLWLLRLPSRPSLRLNMVTVPTTNVRLKLMLRQRQTLKQRQKLRLKQRQRQTLKQRQRLRLRLRLKQRQRLRLRLKQRQRLKLRQRLRQRQTQRATHGLRWLKIYMALKVTTTLLCENMSSVMLMLSQLGLCKTTVYTEASEDDVFSKKINKRKFSDVHCKAEKTKKSNATDYEINKIGMILFEFGSLDQN